MLIILMINIPLQIETMLIMMRKEMKLLVMVVEEHEFQDVTIIFLKKDKLLKKLFRLRFN